MALMVRSRATPPPATIPSSTAARVASVIGIGIILGRLLIGWLIDRVFAPSVAAVIFVIAAGGCLLLAYGGAEHARLAAFLIGFALGAEVDLMAFMDDYRSGNFKVKTLETQWNSKITPFKKTIYDETARGAQPGQSDQYGSYEFFELNTTSHKYMFTTLVNITSPHASILFP